MSPGRCSRCPPLRPVLIAAAVAYILYLAYHIATAPPLAAGPGRGGRAVAGRRLLLGVANPKAWVAIGAVFVERPHLGRGRASTPA